MKHILFFLFMIAALSAIGQTTKRNTVAKTRECSINQVITGSDTVYVMLGQNAKYRQVIDMVIIKSGSARDIYSLLMECMKFLPEKDGSSMEYNGTTLLMAGSRLAVYPTGDQLGYVLLRKDVITKLQTDLRGHL